ncbi:hypothetical protein ABFS83_13G072300 [Erythranthe nasuta]
MNPNNPKMTSPYLKITEGDDEEDEGESDVELEFVGSPLKRKKINLGQGSSGRRSGGGGAAAPPCCLVESCRKSLSGCKNYYQRHKVCEVHAKAPVVFVDGLGQRFCQQCSRFHEVTEFDETKRSCRRRLAGHNERRRKSSLEPNTRPKP